MARPELWEQADQDLYQVLGVPPDAPPAKIQTAWRVAAKRTHPDLGGTQARFRAVHIAYLVLSDTDLRSRYDRSRSPRVPPPPDNEVPRVPVPAAKRRNLVWLAILAAVLAVVLSYAWPAFTIVAGMICGVIVTIGYIRLAHGRTRWR